MSPKSTAAATAGLAGTWHAVVAYRDDHPVGMGRVILRQRAPRTAYISLIADGDARHLYARYGFVETAPDSVGMAFRL